ncbi:MAG TPA: BON domain-containing protein [Abditibacteriaceae bacterium]|nr:BON domain-containing protein [Abditibacteriaceae bacterium]
MATNKNEDRALARSARQALAKSPLDINELIVSCHDGVIMLTGKVRQARGTQGTSLQKELEVMKAMIRSTRGVKDVIADRVQMIART